jgi:hypothetical protein
MKETISLFNVILTPTPKFGIEFLQGYFNLANELGLVKDFLIKFNTLRFFNCTLKEKDFIADSAYNKFGFSPVKIDISEIKILGDSND